MSMTPFSEDTQVLDVAEAHGLEIVARHDVIEVTAALPAAFRCPTCKRVDYARIRRAWAEGIEVPGATATARVEFVLRPKERKPDADTGDPAGVR